jgi:hypothetical protein
MIRFKSSIVAFIAAGLISLPLLLKVSSHLTSPHLISTPLLPQVSSHLTSPHLTTFIAAGLI